jgi:Zn-dependent protease
MITKKEIIAIFVATLILGFAVNLLESLSTFLYASLAIFVVIIANVISKKITSYYLDSEVEIKLWEFKRYGYKPKHKLSKNFPAGAFIPILSKIFLFPINGFAWMASLVFDVKPKIYKAVKRHGPYAFSEITENQIGLIAAAGIFINLILGFLGYLIGFSEFATLSIWYALFNMIPISDLDGNKIFFGNTILWIFLAIITAIATLYTFFLI